MFKINIRIIDDIEQLKSMNPSFFDSDFSHITGFIEIMFGEHKEGCYYHENPLREGETGDELLDYWLNKLLDVVNTITTTKYAAIKQLETVNKWLEFKLNDENIIINVAVDIAEKNNKLFVKEFFDGYIYIEPIDFSIDFICFMNEVKNAAKRFLDEIKEINPELLKTKMAMELLNKLNV